MFERSNEIELLAHRMDYVLSSPHPVRWLGWWSIAVCSTVLILRIHALSQINEYICTEIFLDWLCDSVYLNIPFFLLAFSQLHKNCQMGIDVLVLSGNSYISLVCCQRMILKYLIPVKLSIGILPKYALLEKYNLTEVCHFCK